MTNIKTIISFIVLSINLFFLFGCGKKELTKSSSAHTLYTTPGGKINTLDFTPLYVILYPNN